MKKYIIFLSAFLSGTIAAQAILECPRAGQEVSIYDISADALEFYKDRCSLQPNPKTGLFESLAVKTFRAPTMNRVTMRAPGINQIIVQ